MTDPDGGEPTAKKSGLDQWDVWTFIVPLLAVLPMLLFGVADLWNRPHMRFFPLTLAILLVVTLLNLRGAVPTLDPVRRWFAVGLLAIATILFLCSCWYMSPYLGLMAAVLQFTGWALGRLGNRPWAGVVGLGLILASMVPLPWNMDVSVQTWFESTAAWSVSKALDAISIACLQNGGIIESQYLTLYSDEICGGFSSIFAFVSIAMIMLALQHRSLVVSALVIALVPLWTLLCYFLRLLTILLAYEYWQRDLSSGWDFLILEVATGVVTLLLIWLSSRVISRFFEPIPVADAQFGPIFSGLNKAFCWPQPDPLETFVPEDEEERKRFLKRQAKMEAEKVVRPPFDWRSNPISLWGIRALTCMLLLGAIAPVRALASGGIASLNFGSPSISRTSAEALATAESFPQSLGGSLWRRLSFEVAHIQSRRRATEHQLRWTYQVGRHLAVAVVRLPYRGWHDPTNELTRRGWSVDKTEVFREEDWPMLEVELTNELGGRAYLLYSLFTPDGRPFQNVPAYLDSSSADSADSESQRSQSTEASAVTYLFQVMVESGDNLSRKELVELRNGFLELRSIAQQLPTGPISPTNEAESDQTAEP